MSIVIPPELNWLVKITAGEDWPKGDEDGLRELSQVWTDTATQVAQVVGELDSHTRGVLASMHGQPAEQFQEFISDLRSNLPQLAQTSAETAKMAFDQAAEVEYAKWMIISQMIITAAEIAYAIAMAPFTFGASMAWIPAAKAIATAVVRQIIRRLLQHVAIEVVSQVALDAAIQGIQMLKGDRTTWNTQATAGAALGGAVSGVVGGGAGHLIGKGLGGHAGSFVGKTITGAGAGAAAGLGSTAATNAAFGGDGDLGWAAASGAFGGAAGAHGHRGGGSNVHGPGPMNLHQIEAPDGVFGGGTRGPGADGPPGSGFPTTGGAGLGDAGGSREDGPLGDGGTSSGGGPRGLAGLDPASSPSGGAGTEPSSGENGPGAAGRQESPGSPAPQTGSSPAFDEPAAGGPVPTQQPSGNPPASPSLSGRQEGGKSPRSQEPAVGNLAPAPQPIVDVPAGQQLGGQAPGPNEPAAGPAPQPTTDTPASQQPGGESPRSPDPVAGNPAPAPQPIADIPAVQQQGGQAPSPNEPASADFVPAPQPNVDIPASQQPGGRAPSPNESAAGPAQVLQSGGQAPGAQEPAAGNLVPPQRPGGDIPASPVPPAQQQSGGSPVVNEPAAHLPPVQQQAANTPVPHGAEESGPPAPTSQDTDGTAPIAHQEPLDGSAPVSTRADQEQQVGPSAVGSQPPAVVPVGGSSQAPAPRPPSDSAPVAPAAGRTTTTPPPVVGSPPAPASRLPADTTPVVAPPAHTTSPPPVPQVSEPPRSEGTHQSGDLPPQPAPIPAPTDAAPQHPAPAADGADHVGQAADIPAQAPPTSGDQHAGQDQAHTPAPAPPPPPPRATTDGHLEQRHDAREHSASEASTQSGRTRQATVTPTGHVFVHPGDPVHHGATPDDVRFVAVVPMRTGASPQDTAQAVQDLVQHYERAAGANPEGPVRGVALVVGLNRAVDDLPPGQTIDQHVQQHQAALTGLSSSIPVTVVGAGWTSPSTGRQDIPFGAIRQQLVSSPEVTRLAENSGAGTIYLHFGDGDVRSMVGDDQVGLLQSAAPRLADPDAAKIVSGGYRLSDPGGAVSHESAQDAAVRRVLGRTDPSLVYFPEPNTFYRYDGGDGRGALDPGHDFGVFDQEGAKLVASATAHDYGGGRPVTAWHGDLAITTDGARVNAGGNVDPQSHATANTWGNRVGPWMEAQGVRIDGDRLNRLAQYATGAPGVARATIAADLKDLSTHHDRALVTTLAQLMNDSRTAVRTPEAIGPDGKVDTVRPAAAPPPGDAPRGNGPTRTDPPSGTLWREGPTAPAGRGDHVVGSSAFEHRRDGAPVATVHTESFRVTRGADGGLEHVGSLLRSEVVTTHYEARRIQAEDGSWVHDATIPVHLDGDPDVVADVLGRAQDALDQVNHTYRLPNGDQLHVRLENRPAGDGVPTVRVHEGDGRSDQGTWFAGSRDAVFAHESLHALGLPDGYRNQAVLGGQVDTVGVMGEAVHGGGPIHLTDANLQRIQDVADATAVRHDHPLDATPATHPRPVPDDGSGAPVPHVPAPAPQTGPPPAGSLHPSSGHDHVVGAGDTTASVRGRGPVFRHPGDGSAVEGPRFVATVPLHAHGTPAQTHAAVQQLVGRYEAAARTGGRADVTLVIGLNHRQGQGQAIAEHLEHLGAHGLRSTIPVRVVGAEWTSHRRNGLDVPYGAIRQQLATHPEVTAALDAGPGRGPLSYLHLGDADVGSMTSGGPDDTGLFVRAASTLAHDPPRMASGPYRLTGSDAAREQSARDGAVRQAMAEHDVRLVYPPEPNTFYRVDTAVGDSALDHGHDLGIFDQEGQRLADAVRHERDARRWYDELSLETSGARVNAGGREDAQSHADPGVWRDRTVRWANSVHGVALAGQNVDPIAQWATGRLPDSERAQFTGALRTIHGSFPRSSANSAVRTVRDAAESSRTAVLGLASPAHGSAQAPPRPSLATVPEEIELVEHGPQHGPPDDPPDDPPDGRRVATVDDLGPVHDLLGAGDHWQLDEVLTHRPETLRGSGRRVTVEVDERPTEVRVAVEPGPGPLPDAGSARREHVAGGLDRPRTETSTGDQPPELRGSVTAGAVVGPTATVGGAASLAHPTLAKAEAGTTLRDTRTAVLETGEPRQAPVHVTVQVGDAEPQTVVTTGLVGSPPPPGPAPQRVGGPVVGSTELIVPEGPVRLGRTADDRDPFTAVAADLHPDVVKPGAQGRGALDTVLSSAGVGERMPDLLDGHWVDSPDLVALGGHRIESVRMRLTGLALTPTDTRDGGLEPELRGTSDLPTTAATRSGGEGSVGLGGGTTVPPVGGAAQITVSAGAHDGAEVKNSAPVSTRRRADFSGATEGHLLRGTLEIETSRGTTHRVPVEQMVRMSPWQAERALGQEHAGAEPTRPSRRPPEYLTQGRSVGSGRVLGVGRGVDLAAHVGDRFRALGLEGLAPQRADAAGGARPWSGRRDVPGADDPSGAVAADRDLRAAFAPERLAHEMDAMLGDGYRATFAERGWFRTRRVEVRVTARLTDLTDAGPVPDTTLSSTRTGEDRHGVTRSGDRSTGVGVEGRVNVPQFLDGQRVMPAPTAGVRYTHGAAWTASGNPEAGRLTQVGGRPAHAFDGRVTYDVEIASHSRVRRWVRRTTPGLPGREDPTWWPARRRSDTSHTAAEDVTVLTPEQATRPADAVDTPPVHSVPGRTPPDRLRSAEDVALGARTATRQPRLIEIEAFTGTDVLARAARDALVDAAGGDTAILGHGKADATRIGTAFGPQRLAEPGILDRGASLPGLRYGRRTADRVGELGMHLALRNPHRVSDPAPLSVRANHLGGGRAADTTRRSDGVEASAGVVVGVNGTQPTGGATPSSGPGPAAANSARVSHGRTTTTTSGSTVAGTVERGTNAPAQDAVLVRFDAVAEIVAESRNRGMLHDAVRPTTVGRAGREVVLPGAVHAWVSRAEAERLGLLPGTAPVPPPHAGPDLDPPSGLGGDDLRLGAGTVTSTHDLRGLVGDLRTRLDASGHADVLPPSLLDDELHTLHRAVALTGHHSVVGLLERASRGGAAIEVPRARTFGRDDDRLVLRARPVGDAVVDDVVHDGTGTVHKTTGTVTTSSGTGRDAATGAGAAAAGQHRFGGSGPNYTGQVGAGAGASVTTTTGTRTTQVTATEDVTQSVHAGPMAMVRRPVEFTLTYERGGQELATTAPVRQDLEVRVPADDLGLGPDFPTAGRVDPEGQRFDDPAPDVVDAWRQAGGAVTLPPRTAVLDTPDGADRLVDAAVRDAGGSAVLLPEAPSRGPLAQVTSPEVRAATLRALLRDGLPVPGQMGGRTVGGQDATVTLHGRLAAPRWGAPSDGGSLEGSGSHVAGTEVTATTRTAGGVDVRPVEGGGGTYRPDASAQASGEVRLPAESTDPRTTGTTPGHDGRSKSGERTWTVVADLDLLAVASVRDRIGLPGRPTTTAARFTTMPRAVTLRMTESEARALIGSPPPRAVLDAQQVQTTSADRWSAALASRAEAVRARGEQPDLARDDAEVERLRDAADDAEAAALTPGGDHGLAREARERYERAAAELAAHRAEEERLATQVVEADREVVLAREAWWAAKRARDAALAAFHAPAPPIADRAPRLPALPRFDVVGWPVDPVPDPLPVPEAAPVLPPLQLGAGLDMDAILNPG